MCFCCSAFACLHQLLPITTTPLSLPLSFFLLQILCTFHTQLVSLSRGAPDARKRLDRVRRQTRSRSRNGVNTKKIPKEATRAPRLEPRSVATGDTTSGPTETFFFFFSFLSFALLRRHPIESIPISPAKASRQDGQHSTKILASRPPSTTKWLDTYLPLIFTGRCSSHLTP